MEKLTEKFECKQPEYPAFLEGTYTYRYVGSKKEPNDIIGELIVNLGELEDKLAENKLMSTEYAIGQKVYFIYYVYEEKTCPHCGEVYQKEKIGGVKSGNIKRISKDITKDGVKKVYTIEQNSGWQKDRLEEDIFLTYKKAEERLEELGEEDEIHE